MKQLLERKHSTRIIVFALLLTMLAWLAPVNVGVAKAAEEEGTKISLDDDGCCYLLFDKGTGTITDCNIEEQHITEVDLSTISEGKGIEIKNIGSYAFSGCSKLNSVTIPDGVTTIGESAFYGCSGLTSVSIPNSVTTIGNEAFYRCTGLGSVSIPNSVTTIGERAFSRCSGLTSVSIPASVTTIGEHLFDRCSGLTSVSIPAGVTTIEDEAFMACSSLASIDVDAGNQNYSSQDGVLFDKAKKQLIQYPIGNKRASYGVPNSIATIGGYAFYGCSKLSSVSIPNSVTTIEMRAFGCCSGLNSVIISNGVTTIGWQAFSQCSSLGSVSIPDSVTTIGDYAFGYQASEEVDEEEGYRKLIKISGFKIYGHSNDSAAAKYAKEHGFEYILVNNAKKAEQTISGVNSFTKTYGDKAFYLNAKAKTNLTYKTSDTKVAVVDGTGKVTIKGTGKATITITAAATANYNEATKKVTITVKPKKVASVKVKKGRKQMTVSWQKDSKATGYQITYAQNKAFTKGTKNVTISKNKTVKTTVKKLKPKKTYYVKVRAYKKAGSTKIYGAYSSVKTVKVK